MKPTPVLGTPPTVTTALPVVAPPGTGTVIEPEDQPVGDAAVPLKVTMLEPWLGPKPVPPIVITVPIEPEPCDRLAIFGTTVNGDPLLVDPATVTVTVPLPAVAADGTAVVTDVELQFVGVAVAPLNVTELMP